MNRANEDPARIFDAAALPGLNNPFFRGDPLHQHVPLPIFQFPAAVFQGPPQPAPIRPAPQILRPVHQQLIHVQNQPGEELLERRPAGSPAETDAVLQQVLHVIPDVNRQWIRNRAGHDPNFLVNFILENYDSIPLEPGAGSKRLMDVSMISEDLSFAAQPNDGHAEEEECRERKIDALIIYIKQLDKPKEPLPRDIVDYVKRRYPTVRCNVISQLKKLNTINEVFAVCELIALKAFNKDVATELHMEFIPHVIPWLTTAASIKSRKAVPLLPAIGKYGIVHQEIDAMLGAVGPNPPEVTCAICYDDFSKKRSLPCCEAEDEDTVVHHVCHECIRGQARALCTDGKLAEGGQGFLCVEPDCKNVLPWATVKKVLEKHVRKLLSKRLDNEAILALEGLESCKYCSFQMLIEASTEELKVFSCQKCLAEFCRTCKKDWKDHMGRKCDEMKSVEDKKDEARKKLEEELAMAIMRQCHRCKVVFAKDEGCNKMTCRCGATQCYMCRAQDITYKHFCPHVRDPKQPEVCPENCPAKCLLWVKTDDIDKAALNSIKEKARTDRALHELVNNLN